MIRPIYCFIILGLPCLALALMGSGIRTVANRDAAEEALKLTTGERNLFAGHENGGYSANDDLIVFRKTRQPAAAGVTTEKKDNGTTAAPESTEAPTEAADEPLTEIRWITYLFLVAIALLFLLLAAVVLLLAYYILSTRVLNKTTCKEIELQCRCDDCDKEGGDDC